MAVVRHVSPAVARDVDMNPARPMNRSSVTRAMCVALMRLSARREGTAPPEFIHEQTRFALYDAGLLVEYVRVIESPAGTETPLITITPWGRMIASAYRWGL